MTFENWTPKEIAALRRATAKLRAAQPKKEKAEAHRGIYWCNTYQRFRVYIHTPDGKVYCGAANSIEGALKLQASHERRMAK